VRVMVSMGTASKFLMVAVRWAAWLYQVVLVTGLLAYDALSARMNITMTP